MYADTTADDNASSGSDCMDGQCAIVLFTRVPVPGKVKTRLSGVLSNDQCALLQQAMLLDMVEKLSVSGKPLVLCYSDEARDVEGGDAILDSLFEEIHRICPATCDLRIMAQARKDFGERLRIAVDDTFAQGVTACLLIGSDLPLITVEDIDEAARLLARHDVLFGRSPDGGYWLVGLKEPFSELFTHKSFSIATVLADATAECQRHGKSVGFLHEMLDIDVPEDLMALCDLVRQRDSRLGSRTVEVIEDVMHRLPLSGNDANSNSVE